MPTSNAQPMASKEEIAASLKRRAAELWGNGRAEAIGPTIEQTANHVWRISQRLPPSGEEPGFYF